MVGARVDMHLDGDADSREPQHVLEIFVEENLLRTHRDIRRRQASQVGRTGWSCIWRDIRAPGLITQIGSPGPLVILSAPNGSVGERLAG